MNYYNENDPHAVAWIQELIEAGLIPAGHIDQRSICEVTPNDVRGFRQAHFFCGIAGWPLALQIAGWPDDSEVWTGSCPCQPFSGAGKGLGEADARHLWPELHRLIAACHPPTVIGEQVASKAGREWLAGVRADLEGLGYEVGAADLCSPCTGAPHIRQRLYWLAHPMSAGRAQWRARAGIGQVAGMCGAGRLADADGGKSRNEELQPCGEHGQQPEDGRVGGLGNATRDDEQRDSMSGAYGEGQPIGGSGRNGSSLDRMADSNEVRCGAGHGNQPSVALREGGDRFTEQRGCSNGLVNSINARLEGHSGNVGDGNQPSNANPWSDFYVIHCTDGKARRVKSGLQCLAHGLPRGVVPSGDPGPQEAQEVGEARVMRLRGYGNAINPWLTAEFIQAAMEAM